ncbi:MAG TPA: biphenyl 2,3-dioxygenase [Propionibacterium sp.]|nr:biphenyl 2,3-dioxygenase [Propionibacterium sp.]
MELQSLGYVGVGSGQLEDWSGFATGLLGMQVADKTRKSLTLRMDDRRQRLMIDDSPDQGKLFGWEVADAAALDAIANRLSAAGIRHRELTPVERDRRFVTAGLTLLDPVGNRVEIFHGPFLADDPFVPGREMSGFRTGALGLGHAVLTAPNIEPLITFYTEMLGFKLSDYTLRPFKAYFFHLNPRHHSLAMVEIPNVGVHHLMVEMQNFDDVGQAYDLALKEEDRIGVTLGRHANDHMFSFYSNTPSDFMVECGWGGRSIDPDTWESEELDIGPSLWGHDRSWLSPEKKEEAAAMRRAAAAAGHREPVHVLPGNYDVISQCEWWRQVNGG